jgi:hypothetical protein
VATASGFSEAGLQRRVAVVVLATGLVLLPFNAVLWWLVTRDHPAARDLAWYDSMFLRFPGNIGSIVAVGTIVVGSVLLRRAGRTARILRDGIAARATIVAATDTGTRVNHQPQFKLRLSISRPDEPPYEVTVKRVVPFTLVPRLMIGRPLPVRVDPDRRDRVVIDWSGNGGEWVGRRGSADARGPIGAPVPVPPKPFRPSETPDLPDLPQVTGTPTSREDLKARVRAVGLPGTAVLTAVIQMPPVDERRLFRIDLAVQLDNGASYLERDQAVPVDQEHAAKAVAGARVPVRVALVEGVAMTLFEWDRL